MSDTSNAFDPKASLTAGLVELIHGKPATAADLQQAALFALDAIGNIVGGYASADTQAVRAWAAAEPSNIGRRSFVLGASAAVLEMDAMHRESAVHAGTTVVPAVLAMSESTETSGHEFLTAILKGSEAAFRVGRASGPSHYKIYQTSATCGVYGSAMATALLLGLDKTQTTHALGNAGTQSSGLWQFRDTGAMTKQLHAASGAEAGLIAAQLAQHGFTGALKILEGPRGFFKAACPDAMPDKVLSGADEPWLLAGSSIKPWPSSRHTHPAIDAALGLADRVGKRGVKDVVIETYQTALDMCGNCSPGSPHQAKSSLAYCVVAALVDGRVDLDSFTPAAFERHRGLAARAAIRAAEPYESAYPKSWGAGVTVHFDDGTEESAQRTNVKGDPEAPMSVAELRDKAGTLLKFGGVKTPDRLMDAILKMADDGPVPSFSH